MDRSSNVVYAEVTSNEFSMILATSLASVLTAPTSQLDKLTHAHILLILGMVHHQAQSHCLFVILPIFFVPTGYTLTKTHYRIIRSFTDSNNGHCKVEKVDDLAIKWILN